jgi:glycosyltransferase involved in cell wall biosynthesis
MKKIAVVIPAFNEEKYIQKTLEHLQNQKLKPNKIILVNDGSTDNTVKIAASFDIEILNKLNSKTTIAKKQLAETYNEGLKHLENYEHDYTLILDADILLDENYIDTIVSRMELNSNLVISSGIIQDEYSREPRGGGRIVKTKFWKKIGFFYPVNYGFEGYLLWKAESLGYQVQTFDDLIMNTQRKTGATYDAKSYMYYGYGLKALGYYTPYALGRIILFSRKKPKGALYMLKGFFSSHDNLYESELRNYVSKTQKHNIFNFNYTKRTINLFRH